MDPLAKLAVMKVEWDAWHDVAEEFRAAVGGINDKDYQRLMRAIVLWGEELHALRLLQSSEETERARDEARVRYGDVREGVTP